MRGQGIAQNPALAVVATALTPPPSGSWPPATRTAAAATKPTATPPSPFSPIRERDLLPGTISSLPWDHLRSTPELAGQDLIENYVTPMST